MHQSTGFSLNYLCKIATGRTPLTRSFIERVSHKLNQAEEELFLIGCSQPGQCSQPGNCDGNQLGQWLKEKCKAEHLSFRQMATKVGVSRQTICGLINGTSPSIETIKKLARSFSGNGTLRLALEDHLFALAGYRERSEELSGQNYLGVIPLLSPQHQHIIEVLVTELAKIEGVEVPPSEKETRSG